MRQIPKSFKLISLSSIGSGLEYYSFMTYVMLAPYLSQLFFPHSNPHIAMIQTLLVFAVGYIARPVGGILFAWLGDKKGRKVSFLFTILLMGFADIAIGLLPSAATVGGIATIALVLLRFCQGLSQSAELPGAITFIIEHADNQKRGYHCGLLFLGIGLGAGLSSLVSFTVTHYFSPNEMLSFGWRIPFFIGGALAFFGFILRRNVEETPLFTAHKQNVVKLPFIELIKTQPRKMLQGMGIMLFPACMVTFGLYMPSYLLQYFGYEPKLVYLAMTFGFVLSAFTLPVFGHLSDKLGRRYQLMGSMLIAVCLCYGLFYGLSSHSVSFLFGFSLLYYLCTTSMAGCYPAMLAEAFNTSIRYTGVSTSYNAAYIVAGFFPVMIQNMIGITQQPLDVIWLFAGMAVISLVSTYFYQDKTFSSLA